MEKYTASYGKIKNSFVFQNISKKNVVDEYYGLFCIMKNIIQRGNPTKPSDYLVSQLGKLDVSLEKPLKLISSENSVWIRTIKGDDFHNDYPATIFFDKLIPKYLKDYSFVQQLLLPEAIISDIVFDVENEFHSQQVDFYIPQVKLVIEIDGTQHNEKLQKSKDLQRDSFLRRNGVKTIRFTAKSIKEEDLDFTNKMQNIRDIIKASPEIQEYMEELEKSDGDIHLNQRVEYDIVIRFQMLLISLLQKNIIKITEENWDFYLVNSDENTKKLFEMAYNDLLIWLEHLCNLRKLAYKKPNIIISNTEDNNSNSSIVIDFSIYKRWTDENEFSKDIIFIRNDYYDNNDYFSVSATDPIEYKIIFEGENSDLPHLRFMLKNLFGYDDFMDGQLPIIINVLNRLDTIGILPTGTGKSLCYQFACLLQPCISFVVCPILALMYDQKNNLDEFGITRTNHITSDNNAAEKEKILQDFSKGRYLLIWVSPERFQSQKFRKSLYQINIKSKFALAVIDEVHCLSEWGHDFRTSYLTLIKTINNCCPEAKLLGMTATASQFVLEDLKNEFRVDSNSIKSLTSMNRDELNFHLVKVKEKSKYENLEMVLNTINSKYSGEVFMPKGADSICGLVFTVFKNGKKGCQTISQNLSSSLNINTKAYHGDLGPLKKAVQREYKDNQFTLLVATKAFGMGINKKNIRYTVHYGLPWSIESFYQEAGRAGRDKDKSKQQSDCYIVYEAETCKKKFVDGIFALKTDMKELGKIIKYLRNDLNDIMLLWKRGNNGIDRDLETMRKIMNDLHISKSNIIKCGEKFRKPEVEKAIYKLSVLGMIDDWTIEDWGDKEAVFKVSQNKYTEETVYNALLKYIKRFDPTFSETDTTGRYEVYINILNDESLKNHTRYMKLLIKWSYDNIVYNRRQTIKNMMYLCDTYTDSNSFKEYIDNYFRFSETTIFLDNIAYKPDNHDTWFDVFYNDEKINEYQTQMIPITQEGSRALQASLQRYLESYRYNTGLNFVSGIVGLLCNKFSNKGDLDRLSDAFNVIENYNTEKKDDIIERTLDVLKNASTESRNIFGNFLMKRYPEKAKQAYKALQDESSLKVSLKQSKQRLQKFKGIIKW